jgi:hypothetical protein
MLPAGRRGLLEIGAGRVAQAHAAGTEERLGLAEPLRTFWLAQFSDPKSPTSPTGEGPAPAGCRKLTLKWQRWSMERACQHLVIYDDLPRL